MVRNFSNQALLRHITDALISDSSGLNVRKLADDPDVTGQDLEQALGILDEEFGSRTSDQTVSAQDKEDLARRLAHMIDEVISLSSLSGMARAHTLRPSSPNAKVQQSNADLSVQTERGYQRMLDATPNITQRVLRNARYAAGWVSLTAKAIFPGSSDVKYEALDAIVLRYLDASRKKGIEPAEAQSRMYREYVAVDACTEPGEYPGDPLVVKYRWIDLSPQAQTDLIAELASIERGRRDSLSVREVLEPWKITVTKKTKAHESVLARIDELREQEIARQIRDEDKSPEIAALSVDRDYIERRESRKAGGKVIPIYRIHPRGAADIDDAIAGMFPEKTRPDRHARSRTDKSSQSRA